MTMENQEEILDALNSFEKKSSTDIPPLLEQYLRQIAKTGETLFPWQNIKALFVNKLDQVMVQFNQEFASDQIPNYPNVENLKFDEMRSRILESVEQFQGAPFTIQRLCELLTEPKRHYKRSDKFLRGIEKNVLVVSTVDPFGRKIVSETRNMVNGLDLNGFNGGQGDGPKVPQFSTFPTSPLASLEKSPIMKITEQCDEMPEAENEKILKDIMETEKSSSLQEGLQEDTTEPFSTSLSETDEDEENKAPESEQESLKATKNNVNNDMQNTENNETKSSDDDVDNTVSVNNKSLEVCDSTETSGVAEQQPTVQEEKTDHEKEISNDNSSLSPSSSQDQQCENVSSSSVNAENSDVTSDSVKSDTTGTTQETETVQSTHVSSGENRLDSSENQTRAQENNTLSPNRIESQAVTESDEKQDVGVNLDTLNKNSGSGDQVSCLPENKGEEENVTRESKMQETLTDTEHRVHQSSEDESHIPDQSDSMDVDSSCVSSKNVQDSENSNNSSHTSDKGESEVTTSTEVPMEQD